MVLTILTALGVSLASAFCGQLILRLCGYRQWSWVAPVVGAAAFFTVASVGLELPAGLWLAGLAVAGATVGGVVLAWREPAHRPPLDGLLAGLVVLLAALVPFISYGRFGILGVAFNNDMQVHLAWAEALVDPAVARVNVPHPGYPFGPHALVAAIARFTGADVAGLFTGLTVASPVILGWTALAALRNGGLLRVVPLALLAGIPFLVAAFYAQGSFKEIYQAAIVLGFALSLGALGSSGSSFRAMPLAVLVAGSVAVYSYAGLAWLVPLAAFWLVVKLAASAWSTTLAGMLKDVRESLTPAAVGAGFLLLLVLPQVPRLRIFLGSAVETPTRTGITEETLGNLPGRQPPWLALGVWDNPDYELPAFDPVMTGIWVGFVILLALVGVIWLIRRGQWVLPLAAVVTIIVWAASEMTQSPYVAVKAIVIMSPPLMTLAAVPLLDWSRDDSDVPSWWRFVAPVLAVLLLWRAGTSTWQALRTTPPGPTNHLTELRGLRESLQGENVLFLGNDEFVRWELAGVNLFSPSAAAAPPGFTTVPTVPEKPWQVAGAAMDFDSVPADVYNSVGWVLTPRDPGASSVPEGLTLERQTATYDLFKRTGQVSDREILAEGYEPGKLLDCRKRSARALSRQDGVAFVRPAPRIATLPPFQRDGSSSGAIVLAPGTWDLTMPYIAQLPLEVTVGSRKFTVPASADRPGPRLPLGEIRLDRREKLPIKVRMKTNALTPAAAAAFPNAVIATRRGAGEIVPLQRACGRYVDWYRLVPGR